MGKLVTEDDGQSKPLSHKYIEIKIEAIIMVGLGIILSTGVILCIIRILGAEQEIALIIEETMGIICEVISDIEIIITITVEMVIEVKIMIGNRSRSLDRQVRGREK